MEWERVDDLDITTSSDIPNQIYEKISSGVDVSIEKPGLRPFREILQNSDDARATSLTFRFDKDRLYVHNDGWTIEQEFVTNISKILSKNKAQDPETSGNFGSGFRSTYMYTDAPELEWKTVENGKGKHRVYNLPLGVDGDLKWKNVDEASDGYRTFGREFDQPDEKGYTKLGVVFRFPWRSKNKWDDSPGWSNYTWNF